MPSNPLGYVPRSLVDRSEAEMQINALGQHAKTQHDRAVEALARVDELNAAVRLFATEVDALGDEVSTWRSVFLTRIYDADLGDIRLMTAAELEASA
jgi:cob(I)alamin adenosyltransferase